MSSKCLDEWIKNHAGAYTDSLPAFLAAAWDINYRSKLNPLAALREQVDLPNSAAARAAAMMPYVYTSHVVALVQRYFTRCARLGFAMFDENARLLKLYGEPPFLDWMEELGVQLGGSWSTEAVGANAVALGMADQAPCQVVGSQHFSRALLDMAVYFAPLRAQRTGEACRILGGLALIVPEEDACADYLGVAVTLASNVEFHLFMPHATHDIYDREKFGYLVVDKSVKTGTFSALYNNDSIFDVLGFAPCDLTFRRMDTLFDPLPENTELWDVLERTRTVKDMPVQLTVQGKRGSYLLSSTPYHQPVLGLVGICLTITTPSLLAAQASQHIGHNALFTFQNILGSSPALLSVKEKARRIAWSDSNVLLLGESGVGKDLFAHAIHNASARRDKPFVSVNMAALPRDLIVSELFGYESGAFTGSKKSGHIGKFELANGGTIFLDEIGDLPLDLQVALLDVVERKRFMRLGSTQTVHLDVKIISATNANLLDLVQQKKFRLDLYYRLSVLALTIPPLRERGDDVVLLAGHFLHNAAAKLDLVEPTKLSKSTEDYLKQLPWPGNVRELQNTVESILQIYSTPVIEPVHLNYYLELTASPLASSVPQPTAPPPPAPSDGGSLMRDFLVAALKENKYNKGATADYLGVSRKTLFRWLKNFDL